MAASLFRVTRSPSPSPPAVALMPSRLRVVIVQPSLAKYRAPVYRELARRDGIDLKVWYGDEAAITNVEPQGFTAKLKPMTIRHVLGQEVRWHAAQIEAAKQADADVLLLSWGPRYLSLPVAMRAAKRRGLPTVLWGHGYSKSETPVRKWLRDRIAKNATTLLFYDQATADDAVAAGWPQNQIYFAPNAIDQFPIETAAAEWRAAPARLTSFATENGLADAEPIIFVSRLYAENRVDLLLQAIAELQQRRPRLVLIIVGDGPARDDLAQQASELGIGDRVKMLGAIFDESELAPWMLLSRLFVYPSNIGLSLLHAFGYALPVVTSSDRTVQNPEIVALNDGVNGRLVPPDNANALADTIDSLLSDEPKLAAMSAAALQTVRETYSMPAMVDGMEAAIRGAALRSRRSKLS